jgi:hypothetical protein
MQQAADHIEALEAWADQIVAAIDTLDVHVLDEEAIMEVVKRRPKP